VDGTGKTDENAHPHTDAKGRIAVVHNGTINNSYDLKKELQAQGIVFKSETDTEVIAMLIGLYLDKGLCTRDAVAAALKRYSVHENTHSSYFTCTCNYDGSLTLRWLIDVMVAGASVC
jgi:glutamine phosphoribosylpyrophosphate amidotransferase